MSNQVTINQTGNNKYKINGKGMAMSGRKMWATVTNNYGTNITGQLVTMGQTKHEITFTATGWGRTDGRKII